MILSKKLKSNTFRLQKILWFFVLAYMKIYFKFYVNSLFFKIDLGSITDWKFTNNWQADMDIHSRRFLSRFQLQSRGYPSVLYWMRSKQLRNIPTGEWPLRMPQVALQWHYLKNAETIIYCLFKIEFHAKVIWLLSILQHERKELIIRA